MISIAMATYNGEKFLHEQLKSILEQSYSDFELIVCDDCSKDSTPTILQAFANQDSRIHVYINTENLGFKKNFEKAVSFCKGDYIAFCDQDDIWTKDHLQILLDNIQNKDLVCGNAQLIDSDGKDMGISTHDCLSNFTLPETNEELFKNLLYCNFAQGTAMMISRNIVPKVFPIPQDVKYHDWWAASIASLNNGCAYTDKTVLLYRQHGNNVTTTKTWKLFDVIKDTIKQHKIIAEDRINKIKYAVLLETLTTSPENLNSIHDAIIYYQSLSSGNRFKAIKNYKKNYNAIFWTRKPSKKLFFLRFIQLFIFHM